MQLQKRIPWNKGLKKYVNKVCLGCSCVFRIEEYNVKRGRGKYCSRQRFFKSHVPWNKGKKGISGEDHYAWKGDKASYSAIHYWVARNKIKPEGCEKCGKINCRLELANISGKYKRDINDYDWLCVKCHRNFDGWYEKILKKVIRDKEGKFRKLDLR